MGSGARLAAVGICVGVAASLLGCKSDSAPSATPNPATTVTISSSGVSPRNLTVSRGTQVTFTNSDSRAHTINSDPHPTHGDCPEIDAVGFMSAGQSRQTGNLNTARTCSYHDHVFFTDASLQGTITVQ